MSFVIVADKFNVGPKDVLREKRNGDIWIGVEWHDDYDWALVVANAENIYHTKILFPVDLKEYLTN